MDLPIPKAPDLLSQILKFEVAQNDSLRGSNSAKNITYYAEASGGGGGGSSASVTLTALTKSPTSSANSQMVAGAPAASFAVTQKSPPVNYEEACSITATAADSATGQIKKPRLDMAAIDAVLQTLHGLEKSASSTSSSSPPPTMFPSASASEQKLA